VLDELHARGVGDAADRGVILPDYDGDLPRMHRGSTGQSDHDSDEPAAAQSSAAASSADAAPEQRRRNATERPIKDRLDRPDQRHSRHTERRFTCVTQLIRQQRSVTGGVPAQQGSAAGICR
jgi:hypothetical protein